jgi:hypothetical protein
MNSQRSKKKEKEAGDIHPGSMSVIYVAHECSSRLAGQLTHDGVANIFRSLSGRCGEWKAITKPREVRRRLDRRVDRWR